MIFLKNTKKINTKHVDFLPQYNKHQHIRETKMQGVSGRKRWEDKVFRG